MKQKPYTIYAQQVGAGDQALLCLTHTVTHLQAHLESAATPGSAGSLPSAYPTPGPGLFSSMTAHHSFSCPSCTSKLWLRGDKSSTQILVYSHGFWNICVSSFLLASPMSCTPFLPSCLSTNFRLQHQRSNNFS